MRSSVILGAVFVVLIAGSLYGQAFTFVKTSTCEVASGPRCVRSADVNNDGHPDVVTANSGGASVSVLINDGVGGFAAAVQYSASPGARDLALADFNRDTFIDIAVASFGFDSVSVLINNGDGTFGGPVNYRAAHNDANGGRCRALCLDALDINGDSLPDLAICVSNGGGNAVPSARVYLYLNAGGGVLQLLTTLLVDDGPFGISSGDLSGDGRTDFAVASRDYGVTRFINRGDSTFSSSHFTVGWQPSPLCAVDANADGDLDLYVGNTDSRDIWFLRNSGSGSFVKAWTANMTDMPMTLFASDLDKDADPDLLVTTDVGGYLLIMENNGSGGLVSQTSVVTGGVPSFACADDFDGDGDNDLAVADLGGSAVVIMSNTTDEEPQAPLFDNCKAWSAQSHQPFDVCAADVDRDGRDELLYSSYVFTGNMFMPYVWMLAHTSGGVDMSRVMEWYGGGYPDPFLEVSVADLNGDSAVDILAGDMFKTGSVLNLGNGTFGSYRYCWSRSGIMAVGDLDRVNGQDLVVGIDSLWVGLHDGSGGFNEAARYGIRDTIRSVVIADLDHDALRDIIVASGRLTALFNNGDSTFDAVEISIAGTGVSAADAADLNGDGWTDLMVAYETSIMSVFLNHGDGTFTTHDDYGAGASPVSICATDIDDDGHPDLAVANRNSNDVSVFLNDGAGAFTSRGRYPVGREPRSICAADFDGDTDMDLAVACHGGTGGTKTGTFCVLYNNQKEPTEVAEDGPPGRLPTGFRLSQNYPNPFNPGTTIEYRLPQRCRVVMEIFNVLGQRIRTLVDREEAAGSYAAAWDGTNAAGAPVAGGVYLYRLRAGDYVETRKMSLLK